MTTESPRSYCIFKCNICFEAVSCEPVVTQCGHMYCWPCLYMWLEPGMTMRERRELQQRNVSGSIPSNTTSNVVNHARRQCPACKHPCSVSNIVPVYGIEVKKEGERENEEDVTTTPVIESAERATPTVAETVNDDQEEAAAVDAHDSSGEQESVSTTTLNSPRRSNTIEDENLSPNNATEATVDEHDSSTLGLRQRRNRPMHIPTRPSVTSPLRTMRNAADEPQQSMQQSTAVAIYEHSPTRQYQHQTYYRRASLSSGLDLFFEQITGLSSGSNNIPSLHSRQGTGQQQQQNNTDSTSSVALDNSDATEFLSRLLLMLGSFVIFCLLLF